MAAPTEDVCDNTDKLPANDATSATPDDQGTAADVLADVPSDVPSVGSREDNVSEDLPSEAVNLDSKEPPSSLLRMGRQLLREGNIDDALDTLSRALEVRMDLGSETAPPLGPYYLEYGNALLKKAESSNELFRLDRGSTVATTASEGAEGGEEGGTNDSDEQLAWEVLEMARLCYDGLLKELEVSAKLPLPVGCPPQMPREEGSTEAVVQDAMFVHMRLGDLLLMEEQFAGAVSEFKEALELAAKCNMHYTYSVSSTIALSQSLLFAGEARQALEGFEKALKLVSDHKAGLNGAVMDPNKLSDFEATIEDLTVQIDELKKSIAAGAYDAVPSSDGSVSASQSCRGMAETTTSTFDAPKLASAEVVNLGVVKGKKAKDGHPVKNETVDTESRGEAGIKRRLEPSSTPEASLVNPIKSGSEQEATLLAATSCKSSTDTCAASVKRRLDLSCTSEAPDRGYPQVECKIASVAPEKGVPDGNTDG